MTTPKKLAAVAAIFAVGFLSGSAHQRDFTATQIRYVVQPGDTFWDVANRYYNRDSRRLYLLEYHDEIRQLNPQIAARHYQISPGDVINVRYYKGD